MGCPPLTPLCCAAMTIAGVLGRVGFHFNLCRILGGVRRARLASEMLMLQRRRSPP